MNGLPKDFSIDVFNKELEDLADRVNALLKECKDSLCDELEPPLSKDRGAAMQIIIDIKPCISRDELQLLKEEIEDMADGGYNDIIKSVEVVA